MKDLGYGKDYTYAHNYPGGFTPDNYWPEKLAKSPPRLLHLKGLGAEKTLQDRLRNWWGGRFAGEGLQAEPPVVPKQLPASQGDEKNPQSGTTAGSGRRHNQDLGTAAGSGRRPNPELGISQKKLPHWRLDGSAYFITYRLKEKVQHLSEEERDLIKENILFGKDKRYRVYAYCVMDDHIHAVIQPLQGEDLARIMHTWKSCSTNQLQRRFGREGQIWDSEYYDRIIREEDDLLEKCEYVLTNPQRRWPDIREYRWAGWE